MNEEQLLADIFGTEYKPNGTEGKFLKADIVWGWCNLCETAYLKCPKCGNKSCIGGIVYLDIKNKIKCDICPSVWILENFLRQPTKEEFLTGNKH